MSTLTAPQGTTVATPAISPPSLLQLTRVELRKSYDTRAGRWLLFTIGLASLGVVAIALFVDDAPKTFADHFAITQFPIGILLPVLGILLVTSEWSQRSAMTTFTLVPRRSRVLTAKVGAAGLLALLGVAAAALASALATVLTPVFTDSSMDWGIGGDQVLQVVVVQLLNVLAGVAFGMLLLSSPLAIVLYFVLPTAFSILVNLVGALQWVRDWLDLSTTTMPMYDGTLDAQGWAQVATSAALWVALPMVLGWLRIRRAEIS